MVWQIGLAMLNNMKKILFLLVLVLSSVSLYAASGFPQASSNSVYGFGYTPAINVLRMNPPALGSPNDDTAVFQAALNSGGNVYIPGTTNYVVKTLYPTNGNRIFGDGGGSKLTLHSSVSNAPMFDWVANTNIIMENLYLDGGAYGGTVGTTNRSGIVPYAYAGRASYIADCSFVGFDYGIRPYGDKTTTTAHQTSTLNIHDILCYSNFCGVYFFSPDASHVVEYITVNHVSAFLNTWGLLIDAGNINVIDSDLNNNTYGLGIPGNGVNNSHGSIVGSKLNHNTTAGFAITNITTGELFVGNQINANGSVGFISASKGVRVSNNRISAGNLYVAQGNANGPNFIDNNNGDSYGTGAGPFTVLDYDGSARHYNNMGITDQTGDGMLLYATNFPAIGNGFDMPETNVFSLVNSNGTSDIWFAINPGTGTRLDQPIALRKPRATLKTSNFTVLTTDTGTWFNNSGAAGTITNTLPAAAVGLNYKFTVVTAQNVSVKAVGSDTIRIVGQVTAGAGGIACATVGSSIDIYCPIAGQWIVASTNTPWTTF